MGNRSNLLTLRPDNLLNYTRLNLNEFWYIYSISKLLSFLFVKEKIFLTQLNIFLVENKIFLTLFLFFRVGKFIKILKMRKNKNALSKKKNFFTSLFTSFDSLKKNLLIYTIINLNFFLKKKKKKISFFFKQLKREGIILFPRRFNFFLDFLQISVLFLNQKIKASFLVKIFVEIFRFLQKKMHTKFFNFLSQYFKLLVLESGYSRNKLKKTFNLKGLKVIITGKLKGKPRSHKYINTFGSVPIQTIDCSIDYAKQHAFTIYGVFGIKLWLYK